MKTRAPSYVFPLFTITALVAYLFTEYTIMDGGGSGTGLFSTIFASSQANKQCRSPSIPSYLEQLDTAQQHISDAVEAADRIRSESRRRAHNNETPTAVLFLSDSKYEPRFDEMIKTWSDFAGGRDSLVMASLDDATDAYFLRRGIKSVRVFPKHLDGGEQSIREAVLRAKVEVPYILLLKGLRVVMVEMDIYCRSNPLRLDNGTAPADILVSEHNYCEEVNVGFWIAYPTCPVIESFRRMQAWAASAKRTHAYCDGAFDQKLMHYAWLGHGALSVGSHSSCRDFAQRDQVFDPLMNEPVALERIPFQDIMHWAPPWDPRPDPETWPPVDASDYPLCVHIWSGFGPPDAQMRYGYSRGWVPPTSEKEAETALERLGPPEK